MSEAMNDLRPRTAAMMVSGSAQTFATDALRALINCHSAVVTTPIMTNIMGQMAPEVQTLQQKITPQLIKITQEN